MDTPILTENHPCRGKDCKDCETCIFDVNLFKDKTPPNIKEQSKLEANKNMKPICNFCDYLTKNYLGEERRFFNACCCKKIVETNNIKRPMVIDYHTYDTADIERPMWCPKLMANEGDGETSTTALTVISQNNEKTKSFKEMTYTEKRDELKKLPPMIKWSDIKQGGYYVIPKIMSSAKKVIHVEEVTDTSIRCHEISLISGTEYSYVTTIYPHELDAVFIVELHNF